MAMMTDTARKAFPSALRDDAAIVDRHLSVMPYMEHRWWFSVTLGGERLEIPDRTGFHRETYRRTGLSRRQSDMIDCLLTRDYDGFRREQAVRSIAEIGADWATPFIIRALGDYVVQVLAAIHERRNEFDIPACRAFLEDNQSFAVTTRSRVISYWNVYYRDVREHDIRNSNYVGFDLLRFFGLW